MLAGGAGRFQQLLAAAVAGDEQQRIPLGEGGGKGFGLFRHGAGHAALAQAAELERRLATLREVETKRTDRFPAHTDVPPILEVKDLCIKFPRHGDVNVVDHVSFVVRPRQTMGLVGESGCGKSITSLTIMGLLDPKAQISGQIMYNGQNLLDLNQKQMNALQDEDLINTGTRVDLLENKVVLCVPENGDKGIDSFDSLAEHLKAGDILFCMGNSDVPVGQYTQKILTCYQLDEAALAAAGVITYGSNVKEVTTQVTEGSVDAGVVYCTDAYSAGLTPVDEATKEMCGQVIYPAAVLKAAPNAETAKEFLAYLQTDKAMTVFEGVGFSAV